ncbi:hypothetical protein LEP1GSC163_1909 [Leptospira santarosai str. CBC379]|nr:hypothetical protein LEP1GSC163_1909 [Leptospira santarosai str. CBC379]
MIPTKIIFGFYRGFPLFLFKSKTKSKNILKNENIKVRCVAHLEQAEFQAKRKFKYRQRSKKTFSLNTEWKGLI